MQLLYYYSYLRFINKLLKLVIFWNYEQKNWKFLFSILMMEERDIYTSKQVHARN